MSHNHAEKKKGAKNITDSTVLLFRVKFRNFWVRVYVVLTLGIPGVLCIFEMRDTVQPTAIYHRKSNRQEQRLTLSVCARD